MADDRLYRVTLLYDADSERFTARLPELELEAPGGTRAEALEALEAAVEARVERAAIDGEALPAPVEAEPPALELSLTLAPSVARELRFQAQRSGLTVEALALQLVAQGLGPAPVRRAPPPRRAETATEAEGSGDVPSSAPRPSQPPKRQQNRRRRQEGYRPDMDDQANFLAYVRDMEKGGGRRR